MTNTNHSVHAIIIDIEGTTTPISFVHETLFPYARDRLVDFVHQHQNNEIVQAQLQATKTLVGHDMSDDDVLSTLINWLDEDRKAGPLKRLQGMIWAEGYANGELHSPVYADAAQEMTRWHDHHIPLYIYSSGSVQAQKLIFGHSDQGDLTPTITDYFDTEMGHKREARSYQNIRNAVQHPGSSLLFLSDVAAELDAAREDGWQTAWLMRDKPCDHNPSHPQFTDFQQVSKHFKL